MALTNSSGAVVESYEYDIYGLPTVTYQGNQYSESQVGNRFLFTGREWDAGTGLYHYRARAYSPSLGRFLQRDPLFLDLFVSLYSYGAESPTRFTDPQGTETINVNHKRLQTLDYSIEFEDCSDEQKQLIREAFPIAVDALVNAWADASDARDWLVEKKGGVAPKPQNFLAGLRTWFGDVSGKTISSVLNVTWKTWSGLQKDGWTFECECSCAPNVAAKVYPLWSDCHLCRPFFDTGTAHDRAKIIVHEATHYWAGTEDYGYRGPVDYRDINNNRVQVSNIQKLTNADTVAGFVKEVYIGP
jgi:RHS repeat-associated protein